MNWLPVPDYEDLYEVSDTGLVKSVRTGTLRKSHVTPSGYQRIRLLRETQGRNFFIHRLVLMAFIGVQDDLEANHLDGNKLNNQLSNLEWVTRSENVIHAFATGLHSRPSEYRTHCKYGHLLPPGKKGHTRKCKICLYRLRREWAARNIEAERRWSRESARRNYATHKAYVERNRDRRNMLARESYHRRKENRDDQRNTG